MPRSKAGDASILRATEGHTWEGSVSELKPLRSIRDALSWQLLEESGKQEIEKRTRGRTWSGRNEKRQVRMEWNTRAGARGGVGDRQALKQKWKEKRKGEHTAS